MAKKVLKGIGIGLLVLVIFVVIFILYLTVTEYRPDDVLSVDIEGSGEKVLSPGDTLTLLSWNIGYGGLGKDQDFFMDGGEMVRPDDKSDVQENVAGIRQTLLSLPSDVYFLQEVDVDSKRSYNIDEAALLTEALGGSSAFAFNYKCEYVPYPLPTIGKVSSGLETITQLFGAADAQRVALPVPFKWPVSVANLKRCLLTMRVPIEGSQAELVLVNLHLEAYDDGEGKAAQTKVLMDFLVSEYEKGNYVIAGGDFNQTFPGVSFPVLDAEYWAPGVLDADMLPDGWQFACDAGVPSCRLLNEPFSGDYNATQLFVIDGFILSPNVALDDVRTQDVGFAYSDHQPVALTATLSGE